MTVKRERASPRFHGEMLAYRDRVSW